MYQVRPCLLEDLDQVLQLSKEWTNEKVTIGYENVNHTIEQLATFINGYFYVVEFEGDIVGYAFGKINQGNAGPVIPNEERYLEIYEVYIHQGHRGKGLGTRLVKELIETAERNNVTRYIVGSSNKHWEETTKFYEKLGFKMWYVQMYK